MNRAGRKGSDAARPRGTGKGRRRGRAGRRPRPGRAALVVGFAFGAAFGLAVGAVAYFLDVNAVPGGVLGHGIRLTGHVDLAEDVIWFLSGGFIGGMLAAYAAWRADRSRAEGIDREHVIHRTFRVLDGGAAAARRERSREGGSGGTDRS